MTDTKTPTPIQSEAKPLPGTVKHYERHLIVCTGHSDWPGKIHMAGGFIKALWQTVKARTPEMPHFVKMTACDLPGDGPGYDLLLFPDNIRYHNVQQADLPALIEDHLIGDRPSERLTHSPLSGQHIFVCAHANRDERCGACGPPVAARFETELAARGLSEQVTVARSSHVGSHHLAGNVLVYPGGDWYGRVLPDAVPRIIEQHIVGGELVGDLWRGRMNMTPEQQIEYAQRWAQ